MIGETTEAVGAGVGGGSSGNKMPTLEEYGTNLTKLAEEGKLDPVVGRQPQIEHVIPHIHKSLINKSSKE
ncbi:Chaperone protein ClpC2, chloroplastic [Zea mays]|uniref:Chaperone protein ClpC2, chloroplastic n=1 Tax=Zea mays TaxID=4577 RepID=A0A3L6E3Z9_MAIZE|nr:Chaperone protein ClpC2, chloroplastic [Zea mays]